MLTMFGLWLALQAAAQVPKHDVSGTVTNAITGEPLNHALVQIFGPVSAKVLTGPDGRFHFADIPEGTIYLTPAKPGFFASATGGARSSNTYRLTSSDSEFALKLTPSGRISGRLTDENGEGIDQVAIQALGESFNDGRKQWGLRVAGTTDEDGSFQCIDLMPGRYIVFAAGKTISDPDSEGHPQVYAPLYYPGVPDRTSAQVVDLQAGQDFQLDFRLRSQRGYHVSGSVVGLPASNGVGSTLMNSYGQNVQWPVQIDTKTGRWRVDALPSGEWKLSIFANTPEGVQYHARQTIAIGEADVGNLDLFAAPAASIAIAVTRPEGQSTPPPVNALLISEDDENGASPFARSGQPGNVSLSFPHVTPGKYRLNVNPTGHECVESAWSGSVDLLRDYLAVNAAATQPVSINMTAKCAALKLSMNGEGWAIIIPDDSLAQPRVLGVPGSDVVLSPGRYHVLRLPALRGWSTQIPR